MYELCLPANTDGKAWEIWSREGRHMGGGAQQRILKPVLVLSRLEARVLAR